MTNTTKHLLRMRTESLRQFRVAFKKNAPVRLLDDLRAEIHWVQKQLKEIETR